VLNLGFLRKYRIAVAVKIGPAAIFVFTALRFSNRHRRRYCYRHRGSVREPLYISS
jgi:hypothetical protein